MIDQTVLRHHIQKYIIDVLMNQKVARFSQLRPLMVDTNLFSYHLKALQRDSLVIKTDGGYTLSTVGLAYVDQVVSDTATGRQQPKIITMLLIQNSDGDILLQKRTKQPYIDCWTLPYGKVHKDDVTILEAAQRETYEKLGLSNQTLRHVGDCYIRVTDGNAILSTTLTHVFRFETDHIPPSDIVKWVRPLGLSNYPLAPAVEQIITRSFFGDDHFFAEMSIAWRD